MVGGLIVKLGAVRMQFECRPGAGRMKPGCMPGAG